MRNGASPVSSRTPLPDDLDEHALATSSIELGVEDLFPRTVAVPAEDLDGASCDGFSCDGGDEFRGVVVEAVAVVGGHVQGGGVDESSCCLGLCVGLGDEALDLTELAQVLAEGLSLCDGVARHDVAAAQGDADRLSSEGEVFDLDREMVPPVRAGRGLVAIIEMVAHDELSRSRACIPKSACKSSSSETHCLEMGRSAKMSPQGLFASHGEPGCLS